MKFRPLHDRVVIRRAEGDLKSKGGIIIPDTAKEKPQEGEVIAVGPGSRDEAGKLSYHPLLGDLAEGAAKRVLPAEIRLSIRQVALDRPEAPNLPEAESTVVAGN